MFFPHRDNRLHALFSLKPYQGSDPAAAQFLFFGLDANYDPEIGDKPYFPEVVSYLEDGVAYWRKRGYHHPFRHPDYRGDGALYHRRFAEIGFTPDHADRISFVELLDVPTYGRSNLQPGDLNQAHLNRLNDWVMTRKSGITYAFIPSGVARLLRQTPQFAWLPKFPFAHDGALPVFHRSEKLVVYSPFHFSCVGRGCLKKDRDLQLRDIRKLVE